MTEYRQHGVNIGGRRYVTDHDGKFHEVKDEDE